MEILIESEALKFMLHACKSTYPNEFAGFLREKDNVITEILLGPGTLFGKTGSIINKWLLPIDPSICGTVHSHPSSNITPSPSDLRYFSTFGKYHCIVGYPYTRDSLQFYSKKGTPLDYKVVDW
jgi:proteasome lid subunit RPN8/RPN11